MSIQSEINRILHFRDQSFEEVRNKGVTVPQDAIIDDLPDYIAQIQTGGITPTGNINITQAGVTDVTNYATATVASGTEGTPTATKGAVVNNSVTITPSVTNTTGYITGGTKTGAAVTVDVSELVSATLYCDESGTWDVTRAANFVVAAGTEGTPTATKSAVSNHSVSVTPSVTNTGGWITGSTKTGTAVTVSASELVSGSETKTANGTYNVTNLASLVVAVPIVHYYTSSQAPTSADGVNGDIWLQT